MNDAFAEVAKSYFYFSITIIYHTAEVIIRDQFRPIIGLSADICEHHNCSGREGRLFHRQNRMGGLSS